MNYYPAFKLTGGRPAPKTYRPAQPTARVLRIVEATEQVFELHPGAILSNARTAKISVARDTAIYLVRTTPDRAGFTPSTTQIGKWFGRDHSSVVVALQRHTQRMGEGA